MGFRHTIKGHGQIGRGRRGEGNTYAHIVAWEVANERTVPTGMFVCHSCDNPPCVNPAHLFLGTPADNTRDMIAKRRHMHGEKAPWAKLTEAQALEVIAAAKAGQPHQEIAAAYGVSRAAVGAIASGKRWPHLHNPIVSPA